MNIILPDRETVDLLHEMVLDLTGGKPGVHDEKLIQGAIERPVTYVQYVDEYDIDTVCALLLDSIARNHGFRDGNKRTALLAAVFTYRVNKVHFRANDKMNTDFDDLVMWIVNSKPKIDKIVTKLKALRVLHEGKKDSWSTHFTAFSKAMRNRH